MKESVLNLKQTKTVQQWVSNFKIADKY